MPTDRKPNTHRRLTTEEWAAIRKAFEAGESKASIARRTGVDRKTLSAHARAENWLPAVAPQMGNAEAKAMHDTARANVIDIATRQAVDHLQQSGVIDRIAHSIEGVLARQVPLAAKLTEYAAEVLDRAIEEQRSRRARTTDPTDPTVEEPGDIPKISEDALTALRLADMVKTAQAIAREAAGLKSGMPSIEPEKAADDDGRLVVVHQRLEPVKVPLDENGRIRSA